MLHRNPIALLIVFALALGPLGPLSGMQESKKASRSAYDPLKISKSERSKIRYQDVDVSDKKRDRNIPIRVYLPGKQKQSLPVILFSHGLGGARTNNQYLANHWTARGFVCVFLQHPGSDESVWKNEKRAKRLIAMKKAASGKNYVARIDDVKRVIDQLETWNADKQHEWFGRLNLERVGMSGHSFGAHTSQAVGGQWFPIIQQKYRDHRIDAVVAMSPSSPTRGDVGKSFQKVSIPWMLMTGTHDKSVLSTQTPESRLKVYPSLPNKIDRFELLLDQAEHSAFSERALPGDRNRRNPNHHKVILATSTAFWEAYLKEDPRAAKWLQGDKPKAIMQPRDRWQFSRSSNSSVSESSRRQGKE